MPFYQLMISTLFRKLSPNTVSSAAIHRANTHPRRRLSVSARISKNCHQLRSFWIKTNASRKMEVNGSRCPPAHTWKRLAQVAVLSASLPPTRNSERATHQTIGPWATSFCRTITQSMITPTPKWALSKLDQSAETYKRNSPFLRHQNGEEIKSIELIHKKVSGDKLKKFRPKYSSNV